MSASAGFTPGDELFDIVDADDRVIGQRARREVHALGLLHRAVHVMIHDARGRFFLQRRSRTKDTFPDCWDASCTGHVDAGENYAQAAWRELGEELGWHDRAQPLRFVLKLPAGPETGHEFIEVHALGPIDGPFTLHPEEITEGRWVVPEELDMLLRETPDQLAGALRLQWRLHRAAHLRMLSTR